MKLLRLILVIAAAVAAGSPAASAASPKVDDQGSFFSAQAVSDADRIITDIYDRTTPHKEVLIVTVPTLASGKTADDEAESRFRAARVDGVLIFMAKNPRRLAVTVGRHTEERFRGKADVRDAMLERFRQNDFDGGLLAGLHTLQRDLVGEFGVSSSAVRRRQAAPAVETADSLGGGHRFSWWPLAALVIGVIALYRLFGRRTQGGYPGASPGGVPGAFSGGAYGGGPGPGYGGGYGAPGGGGFGRSLFGGVLGAMGGNWLYDRFRGGSSAFGGGAVQGGGGDDAGQALQDDAGDVGSTTSGDWSDNTGSTGGDWGGGDSGGGDSGGGDSGGGDW